MVSGLGNSKPYDLLASASAVIDTNKQSPHMDNKLLVLLTAFSCFEVFFMLI